MERSKEPEGGIEAMTIYRQGKKPPLGKKEEKRLIVRAQNDDQVAGEELVSRFMGLVEMWARRYIGGPLPLDDLVQEGIIGLISAIKHFDVSLGFRFSTFAEDWVKATIHRALRDYSEGGIHWAIWAAGLKLKMAKKFDQLTQDLGRKPTSSELAAALGLDEGLVEAIFVFQPVICSLDTVLVEEVNDGLTLGEIIADQKAQDPSEAAERENLQATVRRALEQLPPDLFEMFEIRYGLNGEEPKTLEEIGKIFGISRQMVQLRLDRGAQILRTLLKDRVGFLIENLPDNDRRQPRQIFDLGLSIEQAKAMFAQAAVPLNGFRVIVAPQYKLRRNLNLSEGQAQKVMAELIADGILERMLPSPQDKRRLGIKNGAFVYKFRSV